jgi:uncharacterized protein
MDKAIQHFFETESNLTFCTVEGDAPYCANCFYAFIEDGNYLVIKSSESTQHIKNALLNDKVAGTVVPNIHKIGNIKGIQFTGKFSVPQNELFTRAKTKYYLKHPVSIALPGELWLIELESVKMIDNTMGFGKKLKWEKEVHEFDALLHHDKK